MVNRGAGENVSIGRSTGMANPNSMLGTHQSWQITDEMVVTGFLTVQGQSVMVRVVACEVKLAVMF